MARDSSTRLVVLHTPQKRQQSTPAWPHAAELTLEQELEPLVPRHSPQWPAQSTATLVGQPEIKEKAKTMTALSAVLIVTLLKTEQAGTSNTK
ncbi:hypothetical protein JG687_00013081 [Phytophthora cactorum]|nr:hypothetical protein Pcac1_g7801 [Phytophthora cactorum]KAG2798061.1 hypothetical protein PC111_g21014 [Phytophthora cactorum]KAG2806539.1 hypothetical protein PC112_g17808 [Phytophthora cactorum]KAG2847662.1 hypothetical protein PC113_g17730 [Phytophthora cactorum]KAG2887099.1 hypothetical protein PC114_g18959 [Phytophthora cactorum]